MKTDQAELEIGIRQNSGSLDRLISFEDCALSRTSPGLSEGVQEGQWRACSWAPPLTERFFAVRSVRRGIRTGLEAGERIHRITFEPNLVFAAFSINFRDL